MEDYREIKAEIEEEARKETWHAAEKAMAKRMEQIEKKAKRDAMIRIAATSIIGAAIGSYLYYRYSNGLIK